LYKDGDLRYTFANIMQDFWNERYSETGYVYGTAPNAFFKQVIDVLPPGRLLVPGAGEGRDAVYAATLGWQVDAFDFSSSGCQKARALAEENGVSIRYDVYDAARFRVRPGEFDLIALVFFHLPPEVRQRFYAKLPACLAPGGHLVMEVFNPQQLRHQSGGPRDINLLVAAAELREAFADLEIRQCEELITELDEGTYHCGAAEVTRFVGVKG
jgi:SAM-dependent methyltransferase